MSGRFSKVSSDPRFRQIKHDKTKVVLDSRFKEVLEEKSDFGAKTVTDKYGRKVANKSGVDELKRYYRLDEQDESSSEEEETKLDDEQRYKLARGEGLLASSSEEESDDEQVEMENGEEDELDLVTGEYEDVKLGDESARFAVVNLDWDQVKASDLFKVFDGFAPKTGTVVSVTIYPSTFGKERMQHESTHGPPKSIFKSASTKLTTANSEHQEFNNRELRKYQLERLKYYFAVVKCDSSTTAKTIYSACDGAEFEATSNFFDMRFIPDGMEFEDEPIDKATEAPLVYNPVDYSTKALQHSKVELTWDNDDPQRAKVTRRKFTKEDIGKMDFQAYLASSESEGEDAEVYKKLLLGNGDEEVQGDMEVTFTQGLAEKAQELLDKKANDALIARETPFETQIRKQKEKRKIRKGGAAGALLDDEHTGSEGTSSQEEDEEEESEEESECVEISKEHLALLIDDDDTPHFDAREITNKKNPSVQVGFDINTNDARFTDVYSSHHFAIDPTHPSFKKTENMQKILKQKMQLKDDGEVAERVEVETIAVKHTERDLNSFVESVKRKSNSALSYKKGKRKLN